jgi:hypothetical protein
MKHSESIAKLAAALVAAQTKFQPVAMDASNRFNKKYASLDAIMEAVRPVLAEVRLVVVQGATLPTTDEGGRLSTITLETMLIHESGEWMASYVMFPVVATNPVKNDQGVKIGVEPMGADVAAAISFARRVGIASLLCLTNDDGVGETATQPRAQQPRKPVQTQEPAKRPEPQKPRPPVTETTVPPKAAAPAAAPPAVSSLEAKPAKRKAVDIQVPTKDGVKRLGDIPEEELVKMLEIAKGDPAKWSTLSVAIEEVLEEKRNDLPF